MADVGIEPEENDHLGKLQHPCTKLVVQLVLRVHPKQQPLSAMLHSIRTNFHHANPSTNPGMFCSASLPSLHSIESLGQPGLRASSEVHHDLEGLYIPQDWYHLSKKICTSRQMLKNFVRCDFLSSAIKWFRSTHSDMHGENIKMSKGSNWSRMVFSAYSGAPRSCLAFPVSTSATQRPGNVTGPSPCKKPVKGGTRSSCKFPWESSRPHKANRQLCKIHS